MSRARILSVGLLLLATMPIPTANAGNDDLMRALAEYRRQLAAVRHERGGSFTLPAVTFFLFGMGDRTKLLYRDGVLADARTGRELRRWDAKDVTIAPSAYTVTLQTREGRPVSIIEDEQAVWLVENGTRVALTRGTVRLPDFDGHPYAAVLRVLHQEVLVNVVDGKPLPNFNVYSRPWYRDGAMMAMVLKRTGNLPLIAGWIHCLREPFDRNNAGETEADNLGQVLYLVAQVSDRSHPLVPVVLREMKRFEKGRHLEGRSDFALHPVYQTRWARLGLAALGLDDPYETPGLPDSYASLAWWAQPRDGPSDRAVIDSDDYPYLTWAGSHATGRKRGKLSDRDYPLTWEAKASQARYDGMRSIGSEYVEKRLCAPHTWHAAEVFLDLIDAIP